MGIGKGLTRADDGRQITFHQLCSTISNVSRSTVGGYRTLVEIAFVEVVWAGNVHVVEAGNLYTEVQYRVRAGRNM
jgi:hypothetical protein